MARFSPDRHAVILFFPDIKEPGEMCASWSKGEEHQPRALHGAAFKRLYGQGQERMLQEAVSAYEAKYRTPIRVVRSL